MCSDTRGRTIGASIGAAVTSPARHACTYILLYLVGIYYMRFALVTRHRCYTACPATEPTAATRKRSKSHERCRRWCAFTGGSLTLIHTEDSRTPTPYLETRAELNFALTFACLVHWFIHVCVYCFVCSAASRFKGAVYASGNDAAETGGGISTGNGGTTT